MKTAKLIMAWLTLYVAQATAQTPNTLEVWMDESVSVTADGKTVMTLEKRNK